jgi:hypothetical protein
MRITRRMMTAVLPLALALTAAGGGGRVIVGAFTNFRTVVDELVRSGSSPVFLCAGRDRAFNRETRAAAGTRVGYLPQEPELDPALDVRGNVEEAVKRQRDVMRRFDEVNMKFAEVTADDEMNALIEEQARLQEVIDAENLWDLDRKIEIAMDALRLPPPVGTRQSPWISAPTEAAGSTSARSRSGPTPSSLITCSSNDSNSSLRSILVSRSRRLSRVSSSFFSGSTCWATWAGEKSSIELNFI